MLIVFVLNLNVILLVRDFCCFCPGMDGVIFALCNHKFAERNVDMSADIELSCIMTFLTLLVMYVSGTFSIFV